jgi:CheY-like chemotaxis protein
MKNSRPVLLVEDDNIDAMTVKRALKDLSEGTLLVHSNNGEEALGYLRNKVNERPCIILLDLNMPKMNGSEFLRIIKADEKLKRIPVIVLTTSREDRDVVESFEFSVAGYMVKPVDYEQFVETIRAINLYWNLSQLPTDR